MKNIFPTIILVSFSFLFFISCGDGGDNKQNSKEDKWAKAPKTVEVSSLPSISFTEMKELYEECDFIDFIFYNVDFSMSINNKSNIQRTVSFVSTDVAKLNTACKAMGRVFFQRNGELLVEADMYHDAQCHYFVFYKDGKPAYANYITPQGQAYFQKVFSQVKVEPTQ